MEELYGTNVRITPRLHSILHQVFIGRVAVLGGIDVHLPEGALVAVPLHRLAWHTRQLCLVVVAVHPGLGFVVHVEHNGVGLEGHV